MAGRHYNQLIRKWIEQEPVFLRALCSSGHEIVENTRMSCEIRTGKRRIEINTPLMDALPFEEYEEVMKLEMLRILLKHPYQRRLPGSSDAASAEASDMTISDNVAFKRIRIYGPGDYHLPKGMSYEWYVRAISSIRYDHDGKYPYQRPNPHNATYFNEDVTAVTPERWECEKYMRDAKTGEGDVELDDMKAKAELWDEDIQMQNDINNLIGNVSHWGSIDTVLQSVITTSVEMQVDFRQVLSAFRSSLISSKTRLTRMRPNRRTGFASMGTTKQMNHRILIGVDVSGSVTNDMIAAFYAVIDCIFCYDVDRMDVAQFDTNVRHVSSYRKKTGADQIKIMGRGGTSYQEIIDYAIKHSYDGLIIMTDGFGPVPSFYSNQTGEIGVDYSSPYNLGGKRFFLSRTKMAWVCSDSTGYMENRRWMEELGIVIPLQGIV